MSWSLAQYLVPWGLFTACLLLYGFGSPWWTSGTGRAQFALYAALSGVLGLVLVVQLFHLPAEWRDVLRTLVTTPLTVVGLVQLVNIAALQRRTRQEDES